jgi:hypothetical protein
MKQREFITHLVSTVSSFILEGNPGRMVISLHQEEDGLHLCVIDNNVRSDEELEDIHAALNAGARPELADYYGSMGGSDLVGAARLQLIGWQIKKGDVSRTSGGTQLDLWLGSDRFDSSRFTIHKKEKSAE